MLEPTLEFSVTCPDCALESIFEIPIAVIANGLLTGKTLRLHSNCHDRYWTATHIERDKLRNALAMLHVETNTDKKRRYLADTASCKYAITDNLALMSADRDLDQAAASRIGILCTTART
jgi:hypothetical protein